MYNIKNHRETDTDFDVNLLYPVMLLHVITVCFEGGGNFNSLREPCERRSLYESYLKTFEHDF